MEVTPELIAALRQQVAAGASPYQQPTAPPSPGPAAPGPATAPAAPPGPMQRIPGLTSSTMHQLMALGGLDDKAVSLDEQMALANALRQGMGQKHSTGLGGAFGALGDALSGYHSGKLMRDVKSGREALAGERTAGREELAKLLGY